MSNKKVSFLTVLMISMFIFSSSLRSSLFTKLRLAQSEDSTNDELGGSLLDVVQPDDTKKTDLFASDNTETSTLANKANLDEILKKVNSPSPENNTTTENESDQKTKTKKEKPETPTEEETPTKEEDKNSNGETEPVEETSTKEEDKKSKDETKPVEETPTQEENASYEEDKKTKDEPATKKENPKTESPEDRKSKSKVEGEGKTSPEAKTEEKVPEKKVVIQEAHPIVFNYTGGKGKFPLKIKVAHRKEAPPVVIHSNDTCKYSPSDNHHAPFPVPETLNMRYFSVVTLLTFGTSYLVLRFLLSLIKSTNHMFKKGSKILMQQSLLFFLCLSVLQIIYSFGFLDSIPVNFEHFMAALAILGIIWFLFCFIVLLFSIFAIKKWEELEDDAKDDFKSIKKRYEEVANQNYNDQNTKKIDTRSYFQMYEFLILKIYFCIPFFPVFKASTIRREFRFSKYLTYCFLQKLRLLFKLSWTCWFATIFCVLLWSVYIAPASIKIRAIFMLISPLIGIIISIILYIYMRIVYRRVVPEINENNYMCYNNNVANFNLEYASGDFEAFPDYIDKTIQHPEQVEINKFTFHEHFHHRPPSLYENQVAFGGTGFFLLINCIQAICFIFLAWGVVLFFKDFDAIVKNYGKVCSYAISALVCLYFVVYSYLTAINLRWYTLISSIEMKRNETCINKTIKYHLKKAGMMSDKILTSFKRLYFDMKINLEKQPVNNYSEHNQNFNALNKPVLQNLIDINLARFKKIPISGGNDSLSLRDKESYPIKVDTELKAFLKSCGNRLSDEEIEFMLHLIENFDTFKNGTVTCRQLYDIWGAVIHFSTKSPERIIEFTFEQYYNERNELEKLEGKESKELTLAKIEEFLTFYSHYFSKEETKFIREETFYLGKEFSLDAFIYMLISLRRYHPY